ncbi:MAG: hypothetical protein ACK4UN_06685 [Limisphaerales bacterium]
MKNIIVRTVGSLVASLNQGIAGMIKYAGKVELPHAQRADLPRRLSELTTADTTHKAAVNVLKARRLTYVGAKSETAEFIRLVREFLRNRLGKSFPQRWQEVGFANSLAVPRSEGELLRMLHSIKAYLVANPIPNAGPVTSARAQALYEALTSASAAIGERKTSG